jgi:predicted PurR-regulated permease PerM
MDPVGGSAAPSAGLREQLERLMPEGGRARRTVGWGVVAWAALGALALVAVLFALLRRIAPVVPYLVMASMVVFVLNPTVERLVARGLSRRLAASVVFLAAVILATVLLSFMVPAVIHQAQSLGRSSSGLLRSRGGVFGRLSRSSNPLLRQAGQAVVGWIQAHAGSAPQALRTLSTAGLRLAHAGAVLLVGGFLGYLLLLSFSDTRRGLLALVPPAGRARFAAPLAEVRRIVGGYVRARLIVSAVVGAIATLGLWAVHMPFWLLLGIVVGVANLVPMLGSWIGGIPVAMVALVTKPPSFLIVVLAVVTVAHMVDGFVLSPIVLKETTNLHPVVILLAVLLGADLFGFWGILAAIPVAGIANWALREWALPRLGIGPVPVVGSTVAAGAGPPPSP